MTISVTARSVGTSPAISESYRSAKTGGLHSERFGRFGLSDVPGLLDGRHTRTTEVAGPPDICSLGCSLCAACGGHYVMRNGRYYQCSSHTNGRHPLCDQRRTLRREIVEGRLLEGVKSEYLAPGVIKDIAKKVQAKLRKVKRPDQRVLKAKLGRLNNQITNVVETLTAVGKSEALTSKLRELEAEKDAIAARIISEPAMPRIVPNVQQTIRAQIKTLERLSANPYADETILERTRAALRGLLGVVTVTEQHGDVFADIEMGRSCITVGAGRAARQRRTHSLPG